MQQLIRQKTQKLNLQSYDFKQNPTLTWKAISQQGPVITTRQPLLGRIAMTTRYADSQSVLRNPEQFTLDARRCGHKGAAGMRWWVPAMFKPLANNLLTLDGEEHRALRKRVDYAFRRTHLLSTLSQASPKHLGFGTGAHSCFGMHLAIRETATVLNKLIEQLPLALSKGDSPYTWNRRLGLRLLSHLMVSHKL